MAKKRMIGIFLILLGITLISISLKWPFTGMAVLGNMSGILLNIQGLAGIISLLVGILFMAGKGIEKYSLDNIMAGKTSNSFKRSAIYLGREHLNKGKGELPNDPNPKSERAKSTYRELFNLLELEKHRGELKVEEVHKYQDRYNRHIIDIPELRLHDIISYDAKTLSTGNRGVYRYLFDSNGKYLGLVKHVRSHGQYRYEWSD